ncbi:cobaltochelatase CobT-related protein [Ruminococcus albus]|uniref:cobaltochelatase CobT-related protein n=1 Tax=Ruminococcus albus TaxID=1264 RepID=UPI0004BA20B6|nr:VWA domain-containing protein [Ruminococcus albus]
MNEKSKTELLRFWNGYFKKLSKIDSMIVGKKIDVKRCDDSLAYTTTKKDKRIISINPFSPSVPEYLVNAKRFINGLNIHEVGHQRFSDFDAHNNFIKIMETASNINFTNWLKKYDYPPLELSRAYTKKEVSLFHRIWNIIEDTSIEYWTYETTGGGFPNDLRFTVTSTYELGPSLEEYDDPFSQVCAAMLQYGDIGLLKGKFTFPEARKMFLEIQPSYDEAIEEGDAKKRILIAYFVFEKLKVFWEPLLKQQELMEELLKNLARDLARQGKGTHSSDASSASPGEKSEDETKKKEKKESRKKRTIEMTKKELEKLLENLEKNDDNSEGEEVTIKIIDDDNEPEEKEDAESKGNSGSGSSKNDSTNDENGDSNNGIKSESTDNEDHCKSNSSDKSDENKSDGAEGSNIKEEPADNDSSDEAKAENDESSEKEAANDFSKKDSEVEGNDNTSGSNDLVMENLDVESINTDLEDDDIWEDVEISPEEIDRINEEIDEIINNEIIFEKKNINDDKLIDFPDIQGRGFTKAKCKNVVLDGTSSSLSTAYENEVSCIAGDIDKLAEKLKRASAKPNTVKTRRSSGRLSVDRYSRFDAHPTTKLFDKRRTAGENDLAVFISVDESGSMSCGRRSKSARRAAIGIAEACAKAKIPLYIMGFTADIDGYEAYHLHYVRWKNTIDERYSLMNISARMNNFDGYSIRYASRLLQKRTEKNKLLIVISDGQPAAQAYRNYSNIGVADTKDAVRQATADGLVVHGIAIGGTDDEVLKEIYGVNFTENDNLSDLLRDFGSAILKQLIKER